MEDTSCFAWAALFSFLSLALLMRSGKVLKMVNGINFKLVQNKANYYKI